MFDEQAYSRPLAVANALGSDAVDRQRFPNKTVLLTGEAAILATFNGREIARDALLMLPRICARVTVAFPASCSELESELRALAARITYRNTIAFDSAADPRMFDAVLSVGAHAHPELPWTVVNAHGWLARVSSGAQSLSAICDQPNPIAALAATSLGVADVFKRLIGLKPSRGRMLDGFTFSLWSYETGAATAGPPLPSRLCLNLLLAGAGAIGTATRYLIGRLPVEGRVRIVDDQDYGPENYGTSIDIGPDDFFEPKAVVAEGRLKDRLAAKGHKMAIAELRAILGKGVPWPEVVLNGLDKVEARHEIQRIWPDLIIDGATGADMCCQVSCHPWGPDVACLLCLFQHPPGEDSARRASRLTGISEEHARRAMADPDAMVTQDHIREASEAMRPWLAKRIGHKICSVVAEAVVAEISSQTHAKGFAPAAPFVASLSASMIMTELVRWSMTGDVGVKPRYQLNLLTGNGLELSEPRQSDCECNERSGNISSWRAARSTIAPRAVVVPSSLRPAQ